MSFAARYPGRCDDCREPITPGQVVEYKGIERVLVHVVCDDIGELSELDRDATNPVCEKHWLIQPCWECETES